MPYATEFLSGFVVEHYQVVLFDAAQRSQEAMAASLMQMAGAQVPGDTYRNLQIHPTFAGQTFKHILVPMWILTYTYGSRVFQLVVNGYTGRMAGVSEERLEDRAARAPRDHRAADHSVTAGLTGCPRYS